MRSYKTDSNFRGHARGRSSAVVTGKIVRGADEHADVYVPGTHAELRAIMEVYERYDLLATREYQLFKRAYFALLCSPVAHVNEKDLVG